MKKTKVLFLALFMLISVCFIYADLKVTAITRTNNKRYSPRNVVTVWIEDANGRFVKNIHAECAIRTRYLYTWVGKSGWTTMDPWDEIDGWSGATRRAHGTVTANWDLTDENNQKVPYGSYNVFVEYTEEHAQGPINSCTITIGAQNDIKSSNSSYIDITAVYTAEVVQTPTPTSTPTATATPTVTPTPTITPILVNIALNKTCKTSGDYSVDYPAHALTDGNYSTAWGSSVGQTQDWFYVDLGSVQEVNGIGLYWYDIYYSSKYSVYMSNDAVNWTSLATLTKSSPGADVYKEGISFNCRYLAILSMAKSQVAIALTEFEIYQKQIPQEPTPTATPTALPNMVTNGDFSGGMNGWTSFVDTTATGSVAVSNGELVASVSNGGPETWSIHVYQAGLTYTTGAAYGVMFDARAASPRSLKVTAGMSVDPYTTYGETSVNLTTSMTGYQFDFVMQSPTDANANIEFDFGAANGDVIIDNVVVHKK